MRVLAALVALAVPLGSQEPAESADPGAPAGPAAAAEAAPEPAAAPASAEDRAVEERLAAVFAEVEAFRGIEARVRSGVVRLAGAAPTAAARERAEELAAAQEGVVYVENRVALPEAAAEGDTADAEVAATALDQRIAERLRAIFGRVDELEGVRVEVAAGVVRLHGEVAVPEAAAQAVELARGLEGVVYVDDDVTATDDLGRRLAPSFERVAELAVAAVAALPLLGVALVVVALGWLLGRLLVRSGLVGRLTRNRLVQGVVEQTARALLVLAGLLLGLEVLGATALVGALLGTAGLVGLALGFAFRDIAENYLASLILSVRRPFRAKDLVRIGEHLGIVVRLTTRDTVLMTPEGNHLTLPNATVFKATVLNYTRNPLRQFAVDVAVGTRVDLKRAAELGVEVLERMAGVVEDPRPIARVETLGDSTVTIRFLGWVDQRSADYVKARSEAHRLIKAVLDEHAVEMPEPAYRVRLDRGAEPEPAAAPAAAPVGARDEAAAVDVAPEAQLEEQVERDREASAEVDLLADEPEADARGAS